MEMIKYYMWLYEDKDGQYLTFQGQAAYKYYVKDEIIDETNCHIFTIEINGKDYQVYKSIVDPKYRSCFLLTEEPIRREYAE